MFYGARRDVPNFRRPVDLPLGIAALQRWYLQLVPGAYPLPGEWVAEAEGIKHKCWHAAILARWPPPRQYDR